MEENYYNKFIHFLKKHNLYNPEVINYIKKNSTYFDYREEENRDFIGCFFKLNKRKKLEKIILVLPFIIDEQTIIINIHEYIHCFMYYKYLGKKVTFDNTIEIFPMLYEKIYLIENYTPNNDKYISNLNSKITPNSDIKYKIALTLQNKLLKHYDGEKLKKIYPKEIKKLVKKYEEGLLWKKRKKIY